MAKDEPTQAPPDDESGLDDGHILELMRLDAQMRISALIEARLYAGRKGELTGKWDSDERIVERAEAFIGFLDGGED